MGVIPLKPFSHSKPERLPASSLSFNQKSGGAIIREWINNKGSTREHCGNAGNRWLEPISYSNPGPVEAYPFIASRLSNAAAVSRIHQTPDAQQCDTVTMMMDATVRGWMPNEGRMDKQWSRYVGLGLLWVKRRYVWEMETILGDICAPDYFFNFTQKYALCTMTHGSQR